MKQKTDRTQRNIDKKKKQKGDRNSWESVVKKKKSMWTINIQQRIRDEL